MTATCSPLFLLSFTTDPPRRCSIHQNIKLDYLNFRGENISRFFHRVASKNDEILEKKMVANILQLQHEIGDNRVFPLAQAEFGILRGEVLSTMTCEEKQYKVDPNFCTEEIQGLSSEGKKIYITMNSRLVQEEYSKIDCPTEDIGSIFAGKTKQGSETYAVQTPHFTTFPPEFITGPAIEHQNLFDRQKINLTSQLSYSAFD